MKNKILIYDDNCPFCTWYSNLFVRYGFLDREGRKDFSSLSPALLEQIDMDRSRNEIPLLDKTTGKVHYGIDALLELLGQKFPWIKKTGRVAPVNWFLRKLYKLVSFNRKLIVARKCSEGVIDCSPDVNYFYRLAFMTICLVFNTLILFPLHDMVLTGLPYYHLSITELQLAHFGLVFINCLLSLSFTKEKATGYLGQVNMLALMTVLLLLPLLALTGLPGSDRITIVYLVLVALLVFKEYLRRMDYAGVLLSHKWVASINLVSLSAFMLVLFG
ncbi:MAG TPA: DCC1-like thiol-disulfide oxidoreductase family protein [Chitinophagaceae bacterium]|jgi:predicted DCC family thiol-disulfide oxidoreductase YuxK|nr:DCC1-like thiol-disulfide oxidoreductase family protein [Chitinophagaceae bacterium]